MGYYYAVSTGKDFVNFEENQKYPIQEYPGNIWVTGNIEWAQRVGAVEKTKQEAQAIVDAAIAGQFIANAIGITQEPLTVTLP